MIGQLLNGLRAYLYSNLFIATAAVLLCWRTQAYFPDQVANLSALIAWIAFWGTLFTYNLCVLYDSVAYSDKFSFILRYRKWQKRILVLAGLLPIPVLFLLHPNQFIFLAHLAVISFFYTVPVSLHLPSGYRLHIPAWRNVPFLKTLLVAYVWGSTTVIFPLLSDQLWLSDPNILRYFSAQTLFVLAITLPFDIRDYSLDRQAGLRTFANTLGQSATKLLSVFLLAVGFLLLWPLSGTLPELLTYSAAMLTVPFASERMPEWFYTGWLDGLLWLPYIFGSLGLAV